jgi:hypothetical protein
MHHRQNPLDSIPINYHATVITFIAEWHIVYLGKGTHELVSPISIHPSRGTLSAIPVNKH